MQEIILIVYLIVAIALIGIILLQQGKGAEMGASFGAGAANTVFGAAGSGNVLTKTTTILAILFFAIALGISYLNSEPAVVVDSVLDDASTTSEQTQQAVSVESELPKAESGLEAEVAPAEDAVDGTVKAEATNPEAADTKTANSETESADKPAAASAENDTKDDNKKDDNNK